MFSCSFFSLVLKFIGSFCFDTCIRSIWGAKTLLLPCHLIPQLPTIWLGVARVVNTYGCLCKQQTLALACLHYTASKSSQNAFLNVSLLTSKGTFHLTSENDRRTYQLIIIMISEKSAKSTSVINVNWKKIFFVDFSACKKVKESF